MKFYCKPQATVYEFETIDVTLASLNTYDVCGDDPGFGEEFLK